MLDIIPIHLPVDVVVPMVSQVMMVLQMICTELCLDNYSSSESGREYGCDQHTQQHDQFKQSMIAVNKSLIDLLHCQQKTRDDTIGALQVFHQSQKDHANASLIDNIPKSDGTPELYFDWI